MSTEHQQYSTSNQLDVIRDYAKKHRMEIIGVYADEGKSGLHLKGRDSLSQMIEQVQGQKFAFSHILVYDVSRWGRFQDADESAYYEYICRREGISVHYCAEQFQNDGSLGSSIIKTMKRSMAGEYSRELSSKVFHGACRLIRMGFKQGGMAGYGLRRMLVDQSGQQKGVLKNGERKSIQSDRVILIPGPEEEIRNVQWIYESFVRQRQNESAIAEALNNRGILTDQQRPWTRSVVHQILINEKYVGNNVYHRISFKLQQKWIKNPRETWIRADGAFKAIVDPELFFAAQELIASRFQRMTDEEMLQKLRDLWKKHGRISGILINKEKNTPHSITYRLRFGSLSAAYRLIGYNSRNKYDFVELNRKLRSQHSGFVKKVIEKLGNFGAVTSTSDGRTDIINLNGELRVSIILCRHQALASGSSRWLVRLNAGLRPDITVVVRMDASNQAIRDYYLLPATDMVWGKYPLRMGEKNGVYLDAYRFETMDYFFGMAQRVQIQEVT